MQKKDGPCSIFHRVVATYTISYFTCNDIAVLYKRDLGEKLFCIKVGVTKEVENLFQVNGPCEDLKTRLEEGEKTFSSSCLETSSSLEQLGIIFLRLASLVKR